MPKKLLTLCIIHQGEKVLLGMKKRGFGAGRWNGFGDKLKDGETIEECARRELKEEVGIIPRDLVLAGKLFFINQDINEDLEVHLFKITEFDGEPIESEEMKPQWFKVGEVPFSDMWPDDILWFPLFLENKKFKAEFNFKDQNNLIDYKIDVIASEAKQSDRRADKGSQLKQNPLHRSDCFGRVLPRNDKITYENN